MPDPSRPSTRTGGTSAAGPASAQTEVEVPGPVPSGDGTQHSPADGLVEPGRCAQVGRSIISTDPGPGSSSRGATPSMVTVDRLDRGAVAEPAVDGVLRGDERRHRLAPVDGLGQVVGDHAGEQAPAAVRAGDGDGGERGAADLAAGHGELGGEAAQGADDPIAVEGPERPVEVDDSAIRSASPSAA